MPPACYSQMEIWARVSAGLTEPQGSLVRWQGLWHESRLDHLSPKQGPCGRVKQGEGWLLTNSTCWMTVSSRTVPGKAEAGLDLQAVVWLWYPSSILPHWPWLSLGQLQPAPSTTGPLHMLVFQSCTGSLASWFQGVCQWKVLEEEAWAGGKLVFLPLLPSLHL